jgi:hypothetical protein
MKTNVMFWSYLAKFLKWECLRCNCRENQNIPYSIPPPENRAVCERMLKNIVEPGRTQMRNMAHAHCMLHIQGYKHTQDMEYLLLFPCSNCCTNAAFNVLLYVRCLVYFPLSLFMWLIFLGKHDIQLAVVGKTNSGKYSKLFLSKSSPTCFYGTFKYHSNWALASLYYVFHIDVWRWIPLPWNHPQIKLCQVLIWLLWVAQA